MLKHFCGFYLILSRLNIHKELPFTFLAGVVTTIKLHGMSLAIYIIGRINTIETAGYKQLSH